MNYLVYCDGGARGNPGPAGAGFVVFDDENKELARGKKFLGRATNNVAEYYGVIESLKWFEKNLSRVLGKDETLRINFFLDSALVVNQLNGLFKIKNATLRMLAIEIRQLENSIDGQIIYRHIRREKNKLADSLVNQVIDEKIRISKNPEI